MFNWLFVGKGRRKKGRWKVKRIEECGVKWRHRWRSCHWANE